MNNMAYRLLENNNYDNILPNDYYFLREDLQYLDDSNFIYDDKITSLNESLASNNYKYKGGEYYIEGPFAQAEIINRNRRKYPRRDMDNALNIYMEGMIKKMKALGEPDHPENRLIVDHTKSCLLVEDAWWVGNDIWGRAIITKGDGSDGDKIASLMRVGWQCSVSSRGLGKLKTVGDPKKGGYVEVSDYRISALIDIVQTPSAPSANVKTIITESDLINESTKDIIDYKYRNNNRNDYDKLLKNLQQINGRIK